MGAPHSTTRTQDASASGSGKVSEMKVRLIVLLQFAVGVLSQFGRRQGSPVKLVDAASRKGAQAGGPADLPAHYPPAAASVKDNRTECERICASTEWVSKESANGEACPRPGQSMGKQGLPTAPVSAAAQRAGKNGTSALFSRAALDKLLCVNVIGSKTWSKNNKFTACDCGKKVFLKLGKEKVPHEMVYAALAKVLKTNVTLETKFDLEHSLMATPFHEIGACLRPCNFRCLSPVTPHGAQIATLDFIVGYNDRPMNCHVAEGRVWAIDNDFVAQSSLFPKGDPNYQLLWLHDIGVAEASKACQHVTFPKQVPDFAELEQLTGLNLRFTRERYELVQGMCAAFKGFGAPLAKHVQQEREVASGKINIFPTKGSARETPSPKHQTLITATAASGRRRRHILSLWLK